MLLYAIHVQLAPPQPRPHIQPSPLFASLPCLFSPSSLSSLTSVVQCLTFTPLLFSPHPFITNGHRCSHSHTHTHRKGGERLECESLCIRPFGSSTREHKAIGLVLLGAKSFNVLISTEKGRDWPYQCDTAVCPCVCAYSGAPRRYKFSLAALGQHIERISVNTTGCI